MSSPVLPHQAAAFESLLEVGSACLEISREALGIRPRTNTLLVGPTGTGKTFLARQVAAELGVPFLGLSIPEWIPLGCSNKGAVVTWPSIFGFLLRNHQQLGVVLYLDEICKLGNHSWDRYVTVEVFRLLDLSISTELTDEFDGTNSEEDRLKAADVLQNRCFLIAGGAFQDLWETAGPSIGFGNHATHPDISLTRLAKVLPRELTNRFRSQIVVLPALSHSDYEEMLEASIGRIPAYLRNRFAALGRERIAEAARQQQGVRFLEELVLDTILFERRLLRSRREKQLEMVLSPRMERQISPERQAPDEDAE